MPTFQRKPVSPELVEAFQWNPDLRLTDVPNWFLWRTDPVSMPTTQVCVKPGDWIVGVGGFIYVIPAEEFTRDYEPFALAARPS